LHSPHLPGAVARLAPFVILFASPITVLAQLGPPIGAMTTVESESGALDNASGEAVTVYEDVVEVPGAAFIRLFFENTVLAPGSTLKLTSLLDGAVQHLTAEGLQQWGDSSAFFNGSAVRIELIAGPKTEGNEYAIDQAFISQPVIELLTLCGTDDRSPSDHPAVCRLMPASCTAALYSPGGCLLSAGHCAATTDVAQFNVPPSLANGMLQHPPPSEQYPLDGPTESMATQGLGNDWFHFKCLPNTETGLLPIEAQQAYIPLAASIPTVFPEPLIIYGYGSDMGADNQVQQRSDGPLINVTIVPGTSFPSLRHLLDTTGGNSGSPMLRASTGRTIGIHTHGGCTGPNMSNGGTPITFAGVQGALSCPVLVLSYPDGLVSEVDTLKGTSLLVAVEVVTGTIVPESVTLHVRVDDGGFMAIPTGEVVEFGYVVAFPQAACVASMDYFVTVQAGDGTLFRDPFPDDEFYTAVCITPAPLAFDTNSDGDVDLLDFRKFPDCLTGPSTPLDASCVYFEFNDDSRVDLLDFAGLQDAFTGALVP